MKFKKAQKFEASLVAVLEFIRVNAATNPGTTEKTLQKMGLDQGVFSSCVQCLVGVAVQTTQQIGDSIEDVLTTLQKKSRKMRKKQHKREMASAADEEE